MTNWRRFVIGSGAFLALAASACNQDDRSATPTDPVGTWKANVVELSVPGEIVWHIRPDGTTGYTFSTATGTTTLDGTWTYANGIIYERNSEGESASGSIRWLDRDSFVITIKDNGDPAYRGITRLYRRM
jgi:hypothetical protein